MKIFKFTAVPKMKKKNHESHRIGKSGEDFNEGKRTPAAAKKLQKLNN